MRTHKQNSSRGGENKSADAWRSERTATQSTAKMFLTLEKEGEGQEDKEVRGRWAPLILQKLIDLSDVSDF